MRFLLNAMDYLHEARQQLRLTTFTDERRYWRSFVTSFPLRALYLGAVIGVLAVF